MVSMNVLINHYSFDLYNTFFMEKKKNTIVDGTFSRLLYSTQFFVMNGLYFEFPIRFLRIHNTDRISELIFVPYKESNLSLINDFTKMENALLSYYNDLYGTNKLVTNTLSKQLFSGNMKLYRNLKKKTMQPQHFVIKISGIWETKHEIGLATKLLCY